MQLPTCGTQLGDVQSCFETWARIRPSSFQSFSNFLINARTQHFRSLLQCPLPATPPPNPWNSLARGTTPPSGGAACCKLLRHVANYCNMHDAAILPLRSTVPTLSGLSGTPKRTVYCATATTAGAPPQQHAPPTNPPTARAAHLKQPLQTLHTCLPSCGHSTHTHNPSSKKICPLSQAYTCSKPYCWNPVLVAPCSNSGWLQCHLVTSHGRTHPCHTQLTLAAQAASCTALHTCMHNRSTASACIAPLPLLECPVVQCGPRAGPAEAKR